MTLTVNGWLEISFFSRPFFDDFLISKPPAQPV